MDADDGEDGEDEAPMSSLRLPSADTASVKSNGMDLPKAPQPPAESKPRVETLEEKIARVMAGINMPAKPSQQKSVPASTSITDQTKWERPATAPKSKMQMPAPVDAKEDNTPEISSQTSEASVKKKGGARIVKPNSNSSLSSLSVAEDRNETIPKPRTVSPVVVTPLVPNSAPSSSDPSQLQPAADERKTDISPADITSTRSPSPGTKPVKLQPETEESENSQPENSHPEKKVPVVSQTDLNPKDSVQDTEVELVGSTVNGADGPEESGSSSHVTPLPDWSNNASPALPSSTISNAAPKSSPVKQSDNLSTPPPTDSARGRTHESVKANEKRSKSHEGIRVGNKPGAVISKPPTLGNGTVSSAKGGPAFTPQQRRIPDMPSALSAVGYTGTLTTPDSAHPSRSKSGRELWSVTKRSLNESFASPSRALTVSKVGSTEENHSVRVAVRIRPFTVGEIQSGPRRVVSVNGDKLILVNPNAFDADPDTIAAAAAAVSLENMRCNDWAKVFCFDHCFWSYDPTDEEDTYVDQKGVYDAIGAGMAEDVVRGISTCCFAYGHTSTGKTYTMFGGDDLIHSGEGGSFIKSEDATGVQLHESAGFIPRVFMDIVNKVFGDNDLVKDTKITLSFLEIYQEKIRDCLAPATAATDLRVREHPALGPYVENLTKVEVESISDVLELLYRGYEERSTASTSRNRHSSRSHAIATLELSPADAPDPFAPSSKSTRSSTASSIPATVTVQKQEHVRAQMIDLAGSEKESTREDVDEYGTRKRGTASQRSESNVERLELKMIRRSLSTLGYIIKALGQGNSAKGLPFRDSVLTWLLKDALSGRSKTTMMATVSPSHTCFDETLHTLKYAERLCQLNVSSLPGMESSGRIGINDTIDPDLTYALATEYSKLKGELGGNKPGSQAARHLLQQTIADPQQRLARLDPYKASNLEDDARYPVPRAGSRSRPSSAGKTGRGYSNALTVRNDSGSVDFMDQDLKEAYRQLHGKYVELQIELENARTDRDGMKLELQNAQECLQRAQSERFMGSKSAVSDINIALRTAEEEVAELRGIVLRKEETADRLLSELADERQARATVEKTARAQVTELIGRLEALHKQGQAAARESQKWQQECQILQQEKEVVENEVLDLKNLMAEKEEEADNKMSSLEDELRLAMDHVTTAVKERDRTNAEITSVLKEKADMAAREVVLTQRIQELQLDVEKANNESKVKSELEIVKLQRDSLFEVIKQQEQALHMQQQQSEASLKMLHQRQAALDRYEQRSEGEHDELSHLQENLQQLLAQEGQTLYSELIDAKKLISVISSVREKVVECGVLKEDIARLEEEKEEVENRMKKLEQEHTEWKVEHEKIVEQLELFKKHAIDWEARAHYWQQVAKKNSTTSSESRALNESQDISSFASMSVTKSVEYLDLRSENATLQEQLNKSQEELEKSRKELSSSKDDMQKEFASLWMAVEQLNKLDASKDKALAEMTAARDTAVREKREIERSFISMKKEYESLQSELQSIDLDLLDVADNEGIEVGDILHVVHDNHPHVPHDLSDGYFAKHSSSSNRSNRSSRSASPLQRGGRTSPKSRPSRYNSRGRNYDSDAVSEPGYYRSSMPIRSSHSVSSAREAISSRSSPTSGRRFERSPSANSRRYVHLDNDVTEKGLEMQIEELSQFLSKDSNRQQKQHSSRTRLRSSGHSVSRDY